MYKSKQLKSAGIESLVSQVILAWGTATFLLGYFHVFDKTPLFLFGSCIVAIQTTILLLYFRNQEFKDFCNGIPLSTIALLHTWRIFAGWIFLANADKLPPAFVHNAAYGDLLAGLLAISVFIFGRTKRSYYIFNVVGLLDFILAVGTGITIFVLNPGSKNLLTELPLIIIPLFGVPLSGFTHVVSLIRLAKTTNIKGNERID